MLRFQGKMPFFQFFYSFSYCVDVLSRHGIYFRHADGNIKFWDANAGTLQVLYKLKTAKVFEKPKARSLDNEDEPFAIQLISLCAESRKLCVAGASSHVVLFSFKKTETNEEVTVSKINNHRSCNDYILFLQDLRNTNRI